VRTDPPHSGEHTRAILAGLGYTAGQIDALVEQAAVA
jgi:crotonobetainyl-CoA:carnitine CoA-transferase CaiB-like acyl-CoA transferase